MDELRGRVYIMQRMEGETAEGQMSNVFTYYCYYYHMIHLMKRNKKKTLNVSK